MSVFGIDLGGTKPSAAVFCTGFLALRYFEGTNPKNR